MARAKPVRSSVWLGCWLELETKSSDTGHRPDINLRGNTQSASSLNAASVVKPSSGSMTVNGVKWSGLTCDMTCEMFLWHRMIIYISVRIMIFNFILMLFGGDINIVLGYTCLELIIICMMTFVMTKLFLKDYDNWIKRKTQNTLPWLLPLFPPVMIQC